jgi:hypothetical protein
VVGTVKDIEPNLSAEGPGVNDRSLSCVAVVKRYNKRYGAALIQLKLIDVNAKDKGTLAKKKTCSIYDSTNA